ncbi:hypothetical protein [Lysinibacillus sp. Bpr_S20]|uniref:hypothetical protein n=1 Tax=Lysinibacillus sp. Bpr_S20 TaxID=2933964 RepID=UPI0020125E50|nr:hypothetical protein [Lysinibacillus sp. Bpr_S20]MCL1699077.1 hypothetical protein [Lysinibacillus sp. Bpr_S20]
MRNKDNNGENRANKKYRHLIISRSLEQAGQVDAYITLKMMKMRTVFYVFIIEFLAANFTSYLQL